MSRKKNNISVFITAGEDWSVFQPKEFFNPKKEYNKKTRKLIKKSIKNEEKDNEKSE